MSISETLFATKVWNLEVSFLMHFSTEMLSVQNIDSFNDMCNSFFQKVSKWLAMVAAVSSMRGTETDFKGDTLDFPMTKLLCMCDCAFRRSR